MKAEQFIKDYTRRCSNELCAVEDKYGKKVISYHEWLTPDQALSAVQIEREEVIEKAVFWLENNIDGWIDMDYDQKAFVEEFKKAMED